MIKWFITILYVMKGFVTILYAMTRHKMERHKTSITTTILLIPSKCIRERVRDNM